jgi:hypothetical protein
MILFRRLVIPRAGVATPVELPHRVACSPAGDAVFFEASVPLEPNVEGWVCPFFLLAMSRRASLVVRAPLSQVLNANLESIRNMAAQWWPGFGGGRVQAPPARERTARGGRALFFTGGIDSTYALLQLRDRLDAVVFVEGFDVDLRDEDRLGRVRDHLRATAELAKVPLVRVRTNLREHPLFRRLNWEITHMAALAGVAHVLAGTFRTLYAAASDVPPPYGSHPELDPLWSSENMALVNFGSDVSRLERVAAIARTHLRERVRVCWQHLTPGLNCGICEKCLRTRLQFLAVDPACAPAAFPPSPLLERVRALRRAPPELWGQWEQLGRLVNDPPLRVAARELLERSMREE